MRRKGVENEGPNDPLRRAMNVTVVIVLAMIGLLYIIARWLL